MNETNEERAWRESAVRRALAAAFAVMRTVQRGVPADLDTPDDTGRSVVLDTYVSLLFEAVPSATASDITAAVRAQMLNSPFFPAPAELIEQVRQVRRQRALHAAQREAEGRQRALPAADSEIAAQARQEALERIQGILADLAAKMTASARPLPQGGAAQLDAEVARLRALEGKPMPPQANGGDDLLRQ